MEHAKKMALVEPRLLESLQLRNHPQFGPAFHPMVTAMNTLDQEMENVQSRHDMSVDDKVKMYNQVLQRYGTYKDQQEMAVRAPMPVQMVANPTEITPEHSSLPDVIEREELDSAPVRMKKKAQLLVNRIKNSPHLRWTDAGELVYKGQVVSNSVVDLVNDVLRHHKQFELQGWQTFARALKESNVPQDLIGHQQRWQWMQRPIQEHPEVHPEGAAVPQGRKLTTRKKKRVVSTRVPY